VKLDAGTTESSVEPVNQLLGLEREDWPHGTQNSRRPDRGGRGGKHKTPKGAKNRIIALGGCGGVKTIGEKDRNSSDFKSYARQSPEYLEKDLIFGGGHENSLLSGAAPGSETTSPNKDCPPEREPNKAIGTSQVRSGTRKRGRSR